MVRRTLPSEGGGFTRVAAYGASERQMTVNLLGDAELIREHLVLDYRGKICNTHIEHRARSLAHLASDGFIQISGILPSSALRLAKGAAEKNTWIGPNGLGPCITTGIS